MLYPGEELTEAAGYPALVRFEPGRPELPVVVFVTGGGVLGRIAYGPPGGRTPDFLCHWLHEEGFPSLVLSYPIDSRGVFDAPFPQFSITDWAEQSAEIIARYMAAMACRRTPSCSAGAWRGELPSRFMPRCDERERASNSSSRWRPHRHFPIPCPASTT